MLAVLVGTLLAIIVSILTLGIDTSEHRAPFLYERIVADDMNAIAHGLRAAFAQQINARTRTRYASNASPAPQYLPSNSVDMQRVLNTLSTLGIPTHDPNGMPYALRIYGTNALAALPVGGATIYIPDLSRDPISHTFTNIPIVAIYAAGPNGTPDVGVITDPNTGKKIPDIDNAVLSLVVGGQPPALGDDVIRIVRFDDLTMHAVVASRIRIARLITTLGSYYNRSAAANPTGTGAYPSSLDALASWIGAVETGAARAGAPSLSGSTVDGFGIAFTYSPVLPAPIGGAWKITLDTVWGGRYGL